ncbi:MAG: thioredoxin domain-containing protein [Muricomes sp.]
MSTEKRMPNQLANEKSPYLLQHAYNPVQWWPWCEEALNKAKTEDKPVFLSIGYSTCHWCHVMAHESFEDDDVAALLNSNYICIKVDREERPDIDSVYMAVCQMFTGSGGWPLTIIMTPKQKPFWAGTYLPKMTTYGRTGLMELLTTVIQLWKADRDTLLSKGEQVTSLLKKYQGTSGKTAEPDKTLLEEAAAQFKDNYDTKWGGFGSAPKFPTPHNLLFLLQYFLLEKDADTLQMVKHTLTQMFRGGIFDHLGGGFSRYSTDEKWLVPHFEKMLYDNALLVLACVETYHITSDEFFKMIAERTLDYVICELCDKDGGFYCGQDADSDGVEGKYYVFTRGEIYDVLGSQDGAVLCDWFGVAEQGNFEGKNILHLLDNPQYDETPSKIAELSHKLYNYRLKRTRLHKDDKILTSWNGLMIAALANAGWLLDKPAYVENAKKAHDFLQKNLMNEKGELKLRWREGDAAHSGQLDDYAFYAFGLLELYKATWETKYLSQAVSISERIIRDFQNQEQDGFFLYSKDSEQLISRPKETYDGALPSGNSVAGVVLEQLSKLTGDTKWHQISYRQLCFLSGAIQEYPAGHSMALLAVSQAVYPSRELVCATSEKGIPEELITFLRSHALPNLTVLLKTHKNKDELDKTAPFTAGYPLPQSGNAYYLCQNGSCSAPVYDISSLSDQLHL